MNEKTQGSHSTTSSINPNLVVLCSPAEVLPMEDKEDGGSNISSILDTETRTEADSFHQKNFSAN